MPYHIAFNYKSVEWCTWYMIIDGLFLIDISIIFSSTLPETEDCEEVTDRKEIALNYIHGWFAADFFAIIPFDLITSAYRGKFEICNIEEDEFGVG